MELTVSADSTLSMWRKMEVRDGDGYELMSINMEDNLRNTS
jgi:hypothetical protein